MNRGSTHFALEPLEGRILLSAEDGAVLLAGVAVELGALAADVEKQQAPADTLTSPGTAEAPVRPVPDCLQGVASVDFQPDVMPPPSSGELKAGYPALLNIPAPRVLVDPGTLLVREGGTAGFTVRLDSAPKKTVTLSIVKDPGGDSDLVVDKHSLHFTPANWSRDQIVRIRCGQDQDGESGSTTFTVGGPGVRAAALSATELDDEAEGGQVALDNHFSGLLDAPIVRPDGSGAGAGITAQLFLVGSGGQLTAVGVPTDFQTSSPAVTPYLNPITVTVPKAGPGMSAILRLRVWEGDSYETATYRGESASLKVTLGGGPLGVAALQGLKAIRMQVSGPPKITLEPALLFVPEGGVVACKVRLNWAPETPVTVHIRPQPGSDPDLTVTATSVQFTKENWAEGCSVPVQAAPDYDVLSTSAVFLVEGPGLLSASFQATEEDDGIVPPGQLYFSNQVGSEVNAPVLRPDGTGAGAGVKAQLFLVGSGGLLTALEPVTTFRTSTPAAFYVTPVTVTVPNAGAGTTVTVRMRAWDGDSYETATVRGESNNVTVTLGGGAVVPPNLVGLHGFTLYDRVPRLITAPTALTVPEGSNSRITVHLSAPPASEVQVSVSKSADSDADLNVDRTSLLFGPATWNQAQVITVTAAADLDKLNGVGRFLFSSPGHVSASVTVQEDDDDQVGNGQLYFSNRVGKDVDAPVLRPDGSGAGVGVTAQLCLVGSDGTLTPLGPATTFRTSSSAALPYINAVTITVPNAGPGTTVTVRMRAWEGASYETASLKGESNDVKVALGGETIVPPNLVGLRGFTLSEATPRIIVTPAAMTVAEGSSAQCAVRLSTPPAGEVLVFIGRSADGDLDLNADRSVLQFGPANWNQPQTVRVSAAQDGDKVNGSARFLISGDGGYGNAMVVIQEADDDLTSLGQVYFNNRVGTEVNAPVLRPDGSGAGAGVTAQLFLVGTGGQLSALPPTTTFRTNTPSAWGYINGVTVTVPTAAPGTTVTLRMRAWEGVSYDSATLRGESNDVTVVLGGETVVPPNLVGLRGFTLQVVVGPG